MFLVANGASLSHILRQLVDQNSALKKEAGIAERKLLARNERIQNLEALLQDADRRLALQNQKFEAQLQAVKDRLDQARGTIFFTSQVPPLNSEFFQRKKAQFPPHSVSQAESRNLCVAVAVAVLCRVRRPRHPLLQSSPLTHLPGSRMRKGSLLFSFIIVASLD